LSLNVIGESSDVDPSNTGTYRSMSLILLLIRWVGNTMCSTTAGTGAAMGNIAAVCCSVSDSSVMSISCSSSDSVGVDW